MLATVCAQDLWMQVSLGVCEHLCECPWYVRNCAYLVATCWQQLALWTCVLRGGVFCEDLWCLGMITAHLGDGHYTLKDHMLALGCTHESWMLLGG